MMGSKEFSNRSDVLNELTRKARETEAIREVLKGHIGGLRHGQDNI